MHCLALPAHRKVLKLDFQSEFSMSKITRIFLIFFSLRNKILGAHFLLKWFFGNFNFKTTSNGKIMPDFWPGCKARQSIQGCLKSGLLLILEDLLKNWVAEVVASDVNNYYRVLLLAYLGWTFQEPNMAGISKIQLILTKWTL